MVDDTPANLQVLAGMLKDRGYKVRPVPSGKLALLAAGRDPPDLILLDIGLPKLNGIEAVKLLGLNLRAIADLGSSALRLDATLPMQRYEIEIDVDDDLFLPFRERLFPSPKP